MDKYIITEELKLQLLEVILGSTCYNIKQLAHYQELAKKLEKLEKIVD